MNKKFALIRVRGKVRINPEIRDALITVGLKNVHNCVILDDTPINKGQIRKVVDYVTWGEIDDTTLKLLKDKRGVENKKVFCLNSPRKGWERKGINRTYKNGGAVGYRGSEINELIKRMV